MEDIYDYKTISAACRFNKIRAMHQAGYKVGQIAKSIGTSKHNIKSMLRSMKRKETIFDK
mgnify:CR=1 FL=1